MDLADALPNEWSLAGGQMVYTHTVEHGVVLARPSKDADVVIDVRGHRGASENVFGALTRIGFQAEGFDFAGRFVVMRRPDLMGAIAAKAAAYRDIINDPGRECHIVDVLTLSPLLSARQLREALPWRRLERRRNQFVAEVAVERHEPVLRAYFPGDLEHRVSALQLSASLYRP